MACCGPKFKLLQKTALTDGAAYSWRLPALESSGAGDAPRSRTTGRDFLHRQKDHLRPAAVAAESPRIQQHPFWPDFGKVTFDHEVVENIVPRQDAFKQRAEFREVPLTVAQAVERAAQRLFCGD